MLLIKYASEKIYNKFVAVTQLYNLVCLKRGPAEGSNFQIEQNPLNEILQKKLSQTNSIIHYPLYIRKVTLKCSDHNLLPHNIVTKIMAVILTN